MEPPFVFWTSLLLAELPATTKAMVSLYVWSDGSPAPGWHRTQREERIGAPIRLRAKRGLWGAWAEQSAGGNLEDEEAEEGAEE